MTCRALPRTFLPHLGAVLLLLLAGCGQSPAPSSAAPASREAAAAPSATALSVRLVRASKGPLTDLLPASGNVAPREVLSVATDIGGQRIARFHAQVGDTVVAGQLLAMLDSSLLRTEQAQVKAGIDEAKAAMDNARAQAARAQELAAVGMVSAQALQNAAAAERAARARVTMQEAVLAGVNERLARSRLRAPAAGVIIARNGMEGAVVAPGQEVFRLALDADMEWLAEVPSPSASRLKTGDSVDLRGEDGATLLGTVQRVAPVVDPGSRRVIVHVALPREAAVRPGSFLKGHIILGRNPAWWVPSSAVVMRGPSAWVLGVDAQGTVSEHDVRVLAEEGALTAVAGIDDSLELIERGAAYLSQGDRVTVVSRPAPRGVEGAPVGNARDDDCNPPCRPETGKP